MSIDYRSLAKSLIQEFTGDRNVISIPRKFIDLTGDLNSAALLNQILYWSSRTKDPDGWFFKTYPEWEKEIGLTQYQIKRAVAGDKRSKDRLTLSDLGVQTIRKKHGNAVKLHYRVDMDVFFTQFDNFLNMNNVDNQQCEQSMNINNVDNPYTETTTETTEKLFASPHGNAAGDVNLIIPETWGACISTMQRWPDAPFGASLEKAHGYLVGLLENGTLTPDMDSEQVLAIVKQELIAPPTTPQLPKAVEDKFMAVVKEVREGQAKKERKPNPIFDAVAVGSFGLEDVNGDKVAGARIGKIAAWLKKQPGEITPEMIMSFYGWYDRENNHTARPRDVVKFAEHWLKWQATGQKTTPTNEVLADDIDWVLPSTREVVQYADKPE